MTEPRLKLHEVQRHEVPIGDPSHPARELEDALELRIVLYDHLVVVRPDLLPDKKYAKLSKDPKIKREAARFALTKLLCLLSGLSVSKDVQLLLAAWCDEQRQQIPVKPRGRGRRTDYAKETAIRVEYARRTAEAKSGKKEAVVAELMEKYGLQRRRVFEIIENTDPDLVLRALADPDPFGWKR